MGVLDKQEAQKGKRRSGSGGGNGGEGERRCERNKFGGERTYFCHKDMFLLNKKVESSQFVYKDMCTGSRRYIYAVTTTKP